MKFLCVDCDAQMVFEQRRLPGDGTLVAAFKCPACGRVIALLTNPMETQLVASLGVEIGGRKLPEQPFELVRRAVADGREDAFDDRPKSTSPTWDEAAQRRLGNVPSFARGMVKRIYSDYALQHGIAVITPEVMDAARRDLGLEGM
jgi:hypothetical protein